MQDFHLRVILSSKSRSKITAIRIRWTAPVRERERSSRRVPETLFMARISETHVSVVVELVVGEFEFVEGDGLFHPLTPASRRLGMNVDPRRGDRIRLSGHHPTRTGSISHVRGENDAIGRSANAKTGSHLWKAYL